jgi:hypothetical protein
MADRYLDILQFFIPHLDLPIVTWLFSFAYRTLSMSKKKTKNKPRPPSNPNSPKRTPSPEPEALANSPPPSITSLTDTNTPKGNRKGNRPDEEAGALTDKVGQAGDALPTSGMSLPGKTQGGTENKESSLNIRIHLNLHAKVRLDLDAQIYGDIVIGLL